MSPINVLKKDELNVDGGKALNRFSYDFGDDDDFNEADYDLEGLEG